ncbi:hypothetical protein GCM10007159_40240 [Modicisalibacter luteus]|nr:hypothetical protein GCM10007159_40240 [Halomonas lutea]
MQWAPRPDYHYVSDNGHYIVSKAQHGEEALYTFWNVSTSIGHGQRSTDISRTTQ